LKVVELVAGLDSAAKSILPSPLKVNDEVWRSAFFGNRKTRLQVLPESDWGMSKLKMLETEDVTLPLNWVPAALLGEDESTGMIRWGNSKFPEVRVVPQPLLAGEVVAAGGGLAVVVAGGGGLLLVVGAGAAQESAINSMDLQLLRSELSVV